MTEDLKVPGSIPGGGTFFLFFLKKNISLKKKCLEWGSNPRLHRRTELKSAALDHSAIEASVKTIVC